MPSAGGLARPAASRFTGPVCSPAEPGHREAQREAGPRLRREVGRQPGHSGSSPAPDAMPQVRGLPADRVRRVPLLQGHEEVRGPRADEAELHHAAVHRGEWAGERGPGAPGPGPPLQWAPRPSASGRWFLCLREGPAAAAPERPPSGKKGALMSAVFKSHGAGLPAGCPGSFSFIV